jgi:glycosyltransferase involved in cell wall biosynthesis
MKSIKVLVYPKGPNPYQDLLYDALRKQNPAIVVKYMYTSVLKVLVLPLTLVGYRLANYRIIHIHWPTFSPISKNRFIQLLGLYYSIFCIAWMKVIGLKVVWTVHNVLPHQTNTANDLLISRFLSRVASAKIVHSSNTLSQMEGLAINTRDSFIIPHGNYIGAYPNVISKKTARKRLNIPLTAKVILFFGRIEPYKNVPALINAFSQITDKNTYLVIAGKCDDAELKDFFNRRQKELKPRVQIYDRFIEDNEVQVFFNASDVVCLPFRAVTTSGSALLALSFGRPLLAPHVGELKDLPDHVGILYDPKQKNALRDSLYKLINIHVTYESMSDEAVRAFVDTLSWPRIAEKTDKVYRGVR